MNAPVCSSPFQNPFFKPNFDTDFNISLNPKISRKSQSHLKLESLKPEPPFTPKLPHILIKLSNTKSDSAGPTFFGGDFDEAVHGATGSLATVKGSLAIGLNSAIALLTMGLAILAGKCGWEELKESSSLAPEFEKEIESLGEKLEEIELGKAYCASALSILIKESSEPSLTQELAQKLNIKESRLLQLPTTLSNLLRKEIQEFAQKLDIQESILSQLASSSSNLPQEKILELAEKLNIEKSTLLQLTNAISHLPQEKIPELAQGLNLKESTLLQLAIANRNLLQRKQQPLPLPADERALIIDALEQKQQLLATQELCIKERIEVIQSRIKTNQFNRWIGIASLISGIAIFSKAAIDWGVKLAELTSTSSGFGIASSILGVALAGASATAAGGGVGMVSAVVLGPIAALFAIVLAYNFIKKSAELKKWVNSEENIEINKELNKNLHSKTAEEYLKVFQQKIEKIEKFEGRFSMLNTCFGMACTLYTSGVVGQAAVMIAAPTALVAIAASPVVPGIFLNLMFYGGIAMAVFSLQFFTGHDEQKRNDAYRTEDTPGLNRNFLASMGMIIGQARAVESRAELWQSVEQRKKIQQNLWREIADSKNNSGGQIRTPKEPSEEISKPNEKTFTNWLAQPENSPILVEHMQQALQAQLNYLEDKLVVHKLIEDKVKSTDKNNDKLSTELAEALATKVEGSNKENDKSLVSRIKELLKELEPFAPVFDPASTPEDFPLTELGTGVVRLDSLKFIELKKCFIACQQAQVIETTINWSDKDLLSPAAREDQETTDQLLIEHWCDESYLETIDMLVATELQARRLSKKPQENKSESVVLAPTGQKTLPQNSSGYREQEATPFRSRNFGIGFSLA